MNPVASFFHDIEDNGLLLVRFDDFFYFFDNIVDIIPGHSGNRLEFVFQRSEWIFLSVLEHDIDLVLHGVPFERFAQHVEFIGGCFFDDLKLIEVYVL